MNAEPVQTSVTSDLQRALGILGQNLQELNLKVGNTFLGLGNALQSISARSGDLTSLSKSAVELTAAGDSRQMIETLNSVLSDTEKVRELTETGNHKISEISASLQRSQPSLAALTKLPELLNSVRILWKTEAAMLTGRAADVGGLAADMGELREEVAYNVGVMAGEESRLATLTADAVQRLSATEKHEREESGSLIRNARSVLSGLQTKTQSCESATLHVDAEYAAIRDAIDRIVMSLQSEDIARQRIEHIEEAMRQVALSASAGEPPESYLPILVLQRAQLFDAREYLGTSIQSISESLRSLSPRVDSLTRDIEGLTSETDKNGHSFKAEIKQGLEAVSSLLERFSASARGVVATVDSVVPGLASMTKSADKLSHIQAAIRIIAINAAIKTRQLGLHGIPIGTLARTLQDANLESEGHTRTVALALKKIELALQMISERGIQKESVMLDPKAVQAVEAEVNSLLKVVLESNHKLAAQFGALLQLSQTLREEIENACRVAAQASQTLEDFDSILETFDASFGPLKAAIPPVLHHSLKEKTAALASMYSMEHERRVHRDLLVASAEEALVPGSPTANSDLGDNVELF